MYVDPSDHYDHESARAEGWFIALIINSKDYTFEIIKDDSKPIFSSDDEARHFVMSKLRDKSKNHIDAIVFLMTHEPSAYTNVLMSWYNIEFH